MPCRSSLPTWPINKTIDRCLEAGDSHRWMYRQCTAAVLCLTNVLWQSNKNGWWHGRARAAPACRGSGTASHSARRRVPMHRTAPGSPARRVAWPHRRLRWRSACQAAVRSSSAAWTSMFCPSREQQQPSASSCPPTWTLDITTATVPGGAVRPVSDGLGCAGGMGAWDGGSGTTVVLFFSEGLGGLGCWVVRSR